MENDEKEYTITFGKSKRKVNPKKAMYGFNIAFILILVTLMTFANLIIDPTHFDFYQWLTRTLILIGIQIPSIIMGELMSADRQKENPDGLYQNSLKRLKGDLESVKETKIYFSQFFFWFKNKENFRMKCDYLMEHEFSGLEAVYIVEYVKREDLGELAKRPIKKIGKDGKEITIHSISEEKMPYVIDIIEGKTDIKDDSYSYYLTASEDRKSSRSILQRGSSIAKQRSSSRFKNRILKLATFVVFSVIWAMVAVDSSADMGATQTWLNLASRLSSMVAGITSGWLTSITDIKMASRELDAKSEVLETFIIDLSKGIFVPKSYEQLAKEEQEEFERKEEEAKKSVVTPVVVPDVKMIGRGG